jgi:hypothetical protein
MVEDHQEHGQRQEAVERRDARALCPALLVMLAVTVQREAGPPATYTTDLYNPIGGSRSPSSP